MDIGASFTKAVDVFKANPVPFIVGFGVYSVVPILVGLIPVLGFIVDLAWLFAIAPLVYGGIMLMCGKSLSGVAADVNDLAVPFKQRPLDYIVVGLAIVAGLLACCVGAFVTAFLFMFAPIIVAEGASYEVALKRSYELVVANLGECLIVFVIYAVLLVVGNLVLAVGVLVTGPIAALILAQLYIELKNKALTQGAQPPMY